MMMTIHFYEDTFVLLSQKTENKKDNASTSSDAKVTGKVRSLLRANR